MASFEISTTPIAEHWALFSLDLPSGINPTALSAIRAAFFAGAAAAMHFMSAADGFTRGVVSRELNDYAATSQTEGVTQ